MKPDPKDQTHAVLYARFSPRPNAAECRSIVNQIATLREACDERQWKIRRVEEDADVSGALIDEQDRPGIWRAIKALQPNDVLLAVSLDRFGRSEEALALIKFAVIKKKARLETLDGCKMDTAEDRLLMNIVGATAIYERELISRRTKAAKLRYQREGRCQGAVPPIGYDIEIRHVGGRDVKFLKKNSLEQEVVALIGKMASEGLSEHQISRRLNRGGVPARGKRWIQRTVGRIIAREFPQWKRVKDQSTK